jgi:hypothetical protein
MAIAMLTTKEFGENCQAARDAADMGAVFIGEQGQPSHVLMSIGDYQRISAAGKSVIELLYMPEAAELELEFPSVPDLPRPPELL